MLKRERAIEQRAYRAFEDNLKARDPRGVAYVMHRAAGGTDEEFFTRKSSVLPDIDTFRESLSLKKQVYREDLTSKGLSDAHAEILIKNAEDNGTLDAEAEAAYTRRLDTDKLEMERLQTQAMNEQKVYMQKVKDTDTALNNAVNSTALGLVIPDKEKSSFLAYIKEHVQSDGEKFFVAQEIHRDSIERLTEALYLQFKKGDLSSIIQRKANSLNVKRNQLILGKSKQTPTSPAPETPQSRKKTLGELNFSPMQQQ